MDNWPELKQVGDLTPDDFARHPIWVNVHGLDDEEPWADQTDECTRRPWDGALPYPFSAADAQSPSIEVLLELTLADGTRLAGHATDPTPHATLSHMQPALFLPSGSAMYLYLGAAPWRRGPDVPPNPELVKRFEDRSRREKQKLYDALAKSPSEIFPIHFHVPDGVFDTDVSGQIPGFAHVEVDLGVGFRLVVET